MNVLDKYPFKDRVKKRKVKPLFPSSMVCQVIICNTESGKVTRKPFPSWDTARDFVHQYEAGRKYRVSIERIE